MARNTEKIIGTALGLITGAILGNEYVKSNNVPEKERWKFLLGGIAGGAIGGYGLAVLLGSPNDTVNYQLFNGKKCVYHGVAYTDRIEARKLEHQRCGKVFTRMIVDDPKPRIEAHSLEKILIIKHKPFYNIQHKY